MKSYFLLFITFISFLFIRLAPGDPVLTILNVDELSVSQEQVEALREEMGFNEPRLSNMDFGRLNLFSLISALLYHGSTRHGRHINGAPATLELAVGALIVMLVVSSRSDHCPPFIGIAGLIN